MRRARILAFFLDWALCAGSADVVALALTWTIWKILPAWRSAVPYVWAGAGAAALLAFLLRDSSGGRARRWLALEAVDRDGRPPGPWGSIRRNLPLLIPIWNLVEVWPLVKRGEAVRPADRRRGIRVVPIT